MYRLSLIVVCLMWLLTYSEDSSVLAQTPHGTSLSIACEDCHNTSGWEYIGEGAVFKHNDVGFDLVDGHSYVDCKKCHSSLVFEEAESDCISCHTDVHSMSVGDDCVRCHDERNWLVNNIPELHEMNGFPLLGQHKLAYCSECHKSESQLRWDWLGNDCISCHLDDFMTTISPNHQLSDFSQECADCHSPGAESWAGAENFHMFFPLEGKHDIHDCAECHLSEDYDSASPECVSCHMDDFLVTTSPNHEDLGFGTDCAKCHLGDDWEPALFPDHDMFPLVGKHDIQDCAACHDVTDYSNISSECIFCHQDDFNNTDSPNHVESGFNEECVLCHTGDTWDEASYDLHDDLFFPIFSGEHEDEWDSCNECHLGPDYSTFSCIDCHEHDNPSRLAQDHRDEDDYVYESEACYSCHPDGEE